MSYIHERILQKLFTEFGETILLALKNPVLTDLYLNPDGCVWADTLDSKKVVCEMKPDVADNLLRTIASCCNTVINRENPRLSCDLVLDLDGSPTRFRFQGLIPPVVTNSVWCLRKPASKVFTLKEYEDDGIMTTEQRAAIEKALESGKNMVVVGPTCSGKTTLANACLTHIATKLPEERIIVIEDTRELEFNGFDTLPMVTTDTVSMNELVRDALRLNPSRIVVGEVRRGKETLEFLKAINTGHSGLSTIHADTAVRGLIRLEQLIQEVVNPVPEMIAETIDIIVVIVPKFQKKARREISEIVSVDGYNQDAKSYITSPLPPP